jgi:capsular polysaccharide biosynthesis protein
MPVAPRHALVADALVAVRHGDLELGMRLCRSRLHEAPADLEAKQLLAETLIVGKHYAEAERLLAELVHANGPAAAFCALARLRHAQGRLVEAIDIAEAGMSRQAQDISLFRTAANLYRDLGRRADERRLREHLLHALPDANIKECAAWLRAVRAQASHSGVPDVDAVRTMLARVEAHVDENRDAAIQFAEALIGIDAFAKDAISLLERGYAGSRDPDLRMVTYAWREPRDLCAENGWRYESAAATQRRGAIEVSPCLAELRDARVLPTLQWVPLAGAQPALLRPFATRRIRTRREEATSPVYAHDESLVVIERPANDGPRIETAVLLGGVPGHYYHQLVETFGRLAIVQQYPELARLPLLTERMSTPFEAALRRRLGFPEEQWLQLPADCDPRVGTLFAPSPLSRGGRVIHSRLADWYRARLWGKDAGKARRRLYLRRGAGLRRRVLNEDELLAALEPHGFVSVQPERLSFEEQVDLFSQAEIVVAPVGAALTNMLFMPPGGRAVIVCNNALFAIRGDLYFDSLGDACAIACSWVPAFGESNFEARVLDADIRVPVGDVRAAVERALASHPHV